MEAADMQTKPDSSATERLRASELGLLLDGRTLGTRKRGPKPGDNTYRAFMKLAQIARDNDGLLNDAIGRGLQAAGLVESYNTEKSLGASLDFQTDIYCIVKPAPVRLE